VDRERLLCGRAPDRCLLALILGVETRGTGRMTRRAQQNGAAKAQKSRIVTVP
jgi:hypothetical protein